jgi:enoyl-CoA hydratase
VGKAIAMEMVLNNRILSAAEALQFGLVNRVVPVESFLNEALKLAEEVAGRAPVAVRAGKEAVNAVFEGSLTDGLSNEKELFYGLFSTEDQKEGMQAFIEKRKPNWKGK